MAGLRGGGDLGDLPDWNQALQQGSFDCSPVKQPLAQVSMKDGNMQRVSALGCPGAAAAMGDAALKPALVMQPEASGTNAENENAATDAAASLGEKPRSVRRTHTPSRMGLTSRAVRLPSRLGLPPGAKQPEQFVVPPTTRAGANAAAAPCTGGVKSILKRLNFSTTKAWAAAASVAASAAPAPEPRSSTAQQQPQSTMKQLRFDTGTAAKPSHPRHVTFDAATASPAPRTRQATEAASASAAAPFRTPKPSIQEEISSGGEETASDSVNSTRAGSTPFDRRLSSLFFKYQLAGTPELPDEELDELVADGAVRSPSWKRLSSASVPESIRELSKKYDAASVSPLLASPAPPAAAAAASTLGVVTVQPVEEEEAITPMQPVAPGTGGSPAMDPTPHTVLDSMMQHNELYESPVAAAEAAASAAGGQQQQGGEAKASDASQAAPAQGTEATTAGLPLALASALVRLLAPVLVATINQIEQEGAGPAPPSPASPVEEFSGFPEMDVEAATPSGASGRSASDGVPRNSEGIPTMTPTTVTVRRGGYSSGGMGALLEEDGPNLAANLFHSFSGGGGGGGRGGFGFSPVGLQAQQQQVGVVAPAAATPAAAQEANSPGFSFFPASQPAVGVAQVAAAWDIPELHTLHCPGSGTISPEILGFYESQAQQQQAAAAAGTSLATAKPAMPRSIIKSGRLLNEAGTPVLGHAQRGGPEAVPLTITRELQALLEGLRLEDRADMEQMGTVSTLSPVRATGSLRGFLGGLSRAITPVRRSARKMAHVPPRPLEAMLEEADFSYVPNGALMLEDAPPKLEEAEAKAARRAASRATSQAGQPFLARMASTDQLKVSSVTAARRYSTRSAARTAEAEAEAASTPAPDALPTDARRLRTPLQQAHSAVGEPTTPQATLPAADMPVAQDASPQLAESPSFAGQVAGSFDAAEVSGSSSYGLCASTLKKATQSMGTPAAVVAAGSGAGHPSKKERPQLTPTEQGICVSLRRSARRSQGPR